MRRMAGFSLLFLKAARTHKEVSKCECVCLMALPVNRESGVCMALAVRRGNSVDSWFVEKQSWAGDFTVPMEWPAKHDAP